MSAIPAVQSKPLSPRNSAFTEALKVSLLIFNTRGAYHYYQDPHQNVASVAARIVFVSPITQDEVARFQAALAGPPPGSSRRPKASKRKVAGNETTPRAKGKKQAAQQAKLIITQLTTLLGHSSIRRFYGQNFPLTDTSFLQYRLAAN
ncbi:hypothetical protein BDZ89DRAFT_1062340 [Hymenopellis radicata]|nr:hypothetical protein BDZ89DRAFT_1062340 [Hymenopellis radicata]